MGDVEDGVVGNDGMGGCGGVVVAVVGADRDGRVSSVDAVGGRERAWRRVAECDGGVHGGRSCDGCGGGEGVVVYYSRGMIWQPLGASGEFFLVTLSGDFPQRNLVDMRIIQIAKS